MQIKKPVLLIILDGLGLAPASRGNAVSLAKMPFFNKLITLYPTQSLRASGEAVGLSYNESGNSEVGHLNLGAGKIVWQNLPKIDHSIVNGDFFRNEVFKEAIEKARAQHSKLHLLGLASNGGVHSSITHLYSLLELAAQENFKDVYLHLFLDGRDTAFNTGLDFLKDVLKKIKKLSVGKIASLSGRFWAMDRDNQWSRVEKAYLTLTKGEGKSSDNPLKTIEESYQQKIYDEELEPTVILENNKPVSLIGEGDAVIFFNYRADRARELTRAFVNDEFKGFKREKIKNLFFVTMTEYEKDLPVKIAFPKDLIEYPLARIISDLDLFQFHIAETQKYPHVTYFFNGGKEEPFLKEERILIPSLPIANFADQPEMSAPAVGQKVLEALANDKYSFIIVNFANPDMVGHTGNLQAVIKCLEILDSILGEIVPLALTKNWTVLVTADHGNAEQMIDLKTGEINKEHTTNPVPFIVVEKGKEGKSLIASLDQLAAVTPSGILADVAPTILKIMGIEKPKDITGIALL